MCVPVVRRIPTLLHGPGCNLGNGKGVPLVVHYWADLQSVRWFRCYDNISPNAKCQLVLVIALCLVCTYLKEVESLVDRIFIHDVNNSIDLKVQ